MDYEIENQQKSKQVILEITRNRKPEKVIFHETNDGYAGYLGLYAHFKEGNVYVGIYRGTVYDRPPYPMPVGMFLKE